MPSGSLRAMEEAVATKLPFGHLRPPQRPTLGASRAGHSLQVTNISCTLPQKPCPYLSFPFR